MSKVLRPASGKSAASKARSTTSKHAKPGLGKRTTRTSPATAPKTFVRSNENAVRTKTLRLQPNYERGLAVLKQVLNMPINKMVNEAVGDYIRRRTAEVESGLTTTLEQLQAYRRSDPEFAAAREALIEGEVLYGNDDPMEGRIVQTKESARDAVKHRSTTSTGVRAAGPALREVRELLRG